METNKNISVILPIKTRNTKGFDEYFDKAIQSVQTQKDYVNELIIVHCGEDSFKGFVESYDFGDLNVVLVQYDEDPSFAGQINLGAERATSEWMSILEFDDEYSNIWFKNATNYMGIYKDYDAFLPIVVDVDDKGVFVGFTNEATFAANFSSEIGVLTNETLLTYQNFQISGILIKRETFIKNGGLKKSFTLTFGYELFLRLTNNGVKIMSIPRIGYKHTNLREGSIFWNYKFGENKLGEDEVRFWIDLAKKEFLYVRDREIKYEPQEV
jgi:glycosyltransferase involved in cell wall biosynthesis